MIARVLAFVVAGCIGVTGILPVTGGWRCVARQRPMHVGAPCCPKCDPPAPSIGTPCCVAVPGTTLEARAPAPVTQPELAPAPLGAILPAWSAALPATMLRVRRITRLPRGAPPGDRLDRFSAILRV